MVHFNFVHRGKNGLCDGHETFHYICMEKNFMSFDVYGIVPTHLCRIINWFWRFNVENGILLNVPKPLFPFQFFKKFNFFFENINISTNNVILESKLPTYYNLLNQIFNSTYFLGAHFKSDIELLLIFTKVKICNKPVFFKDFSRWP